MRIQRKGKAWHRLIVLVFVLVVLVIPVVAQNDSLSEEEYRALCDDVPVAELTAGAEKLAGRLVALTGQILVWEERQDDGTTTHLIIAVEDPAMTLQSGLLPVYIVYGGRIESFIYDTITVFGRIYGLDTYKSVAVQEKTLPRIDARHIDETDSTS